MDGEAHCLNYKSAIKHEDFETVKIYSIDKTENKKCVVFSDEHGLEGLLYVESCFRKIVEKFNFTGPQIFNAFEDVLQGTALTNWEPLVDDLAANEKNPENFDELMNQYYMSYCDSKARDSMYDYLKSKCNKPVGEEPRTHVRRMELLYSYATKLPGLEEPMTEDQIKRAIFKTFPDTWRKQYIRAGKELQEDSMQDLVTFMQNEKAFADEDKAKKRGANEGDHLVNKLGKNKSKNKKQKSNPHNLNSKVQPNDTCPLHGGHPWKDCFDNPHGSKYRPRNNRHPGSGGRGNRNGGRGFQQQYNNNCTFDYGRGGGPGGRGDFQGRGGRGNAGMNQQNQTNNAYHYERNRDMNRDQHVGNDANAYRQPREREPREQHHFDQIDGYHF